MTIHTTTRPANTGGIDLSHIDVATAVFNATGGGYGGGGQPRTENADAGGSGRNPSDWLTNWGNGMFFSDEMDFSKPPADRDAEIKLLAEPEVVHPLLDLFKGGFGEGDMSGVKNGGPEGTANPVVVVAAVVILVAFVAAAAYLAGAFDDKPEVEKPEKPEKPEVDPETGLTIYPNQYVDPEADTGASLQSPAAMLADMLASKGIAGIDTSTVGVTDILGKFSDKLGKVAEIVNSLKGASDAGDTEGFGNALADLMNMAGVDIGAAANAMKMPEIAMAGAFYAFGIVGGFDGIDHHEVVRDQAYVSVESLQDQDGSKWVITWDNDQI